MSDDQIRDDQQTTMGPPGGQAGPADAPGAPAGSEPAAAAPAAPPETEARRREASPLSVRPLPPTWIDLPPEDIERLTRQVERAFSSEPFPAPGAEGARGRGAPGGRPGTGVAREVTTGPPARARDRATPRGRAPAVEPAAVTEPAEDVDVAADAGAEADEGKAAAGGQAASGQEEPKSGRRRRRGSRGRGRGRRREGEAPAEAAALEVASGPEAPSTEATAPGDSSVAGAHEVEGEPPAPEAAAGGEPGGGAAAEPGGGAAEASGLRGLRGEAARRAKAGLCPAGADGGREPLEEAERGPGDAVAPEPRRGRRRGRRRGHERDDQRREPGAQPAGAGAAAAPAGRVRPGEASAGEASPAEPEHEAELRALESALRAGEPRSAADIGAFDEREQALLTDAWPGAPVREGQGPMRRRSQHGLSMEETFEARRERMADERRARKGTLYVVATPIGNLEDMTFRAVRILKEVKLIAAEDTRQTAKLLNHYQIRTPLTSFFEHNEQVKTDYLLRKLEEGQTIALVSDAGTPGISDPGYVLVKAAVERGVNIVPVPGPCAAVAALSASGLPTDAWVFVGFLPQKEKKRREVLESLKLDRRTLIFYEAPTRTLETIHEMCEVLGNRDMVMIREMTKMHEEVVRGKFSKVLAEYRGKEIKGEVVLAVAGWAGKIADREGLSLIDRIRLYKQESGLPLADVVRLVARETGTPKSEVYRESLKLVGLDPDKIRPLRAEPAGGPVPPSIDARAAEPASGPKERFVPAPEPGEGEPAPRAAEAEEPAVGPEEVGAPVALPEPDTRSRMAEDAQPVTAVGGAEGSVLAPEPEAFRAERLGQAPEPAGVPAERPGQAPEPAGVPAERLGQAPEPAPESSPAGAGNGAGDDVAGVEVVEGRPGSAPVVPLAPRQE